MRLFSLNHIWARGRVVEAAAFGAVDPGFKSLRARHLTLLLDDYWSSLIDQTPLAARLNNSNIL